MKRSHRLIAAATGLTAVALFIGGCGSTGTHTGGTRGSRGIPADKQARLTTYVRSVTALEKPIETAASRFFHSPRATRVQLRLANVLKKAYADGSRQLSKLTPPSVAVTAQRKLVNVWSRVAAQLAKVTNGRSFSDSHAYSVAAAAEQPTSSAYSTILTLP
jgi:hypothetical protein